MTPLQLSFPMQLCCLLVPISQNAWLSQRLLPIVQRILLLIVFISAPITPLPPTDNVPSQAHALCPVSTTGPPTTSARQRFTETLMRDSSARLAIVSGAMGIVLPRKDVLGGRRQPTEMRVWPPQGNGSPSSNVARRDDLTTDHDRPRPPNARPPVHLPDPPTDRLPPSGIPDRPSGRCLLSSRPHSV